MRRFAIGSFVCVAALVAVLVVPACVQAELYSLNVDFGETGQPVPAGWEAFTEAQTPGVPSVSRTYGGVTVTLASSNLYFRNRGTVSYRPCRERFSAMGSWVMTRALR